MYLCQLPLVVAFDAHPLGNADEGPGIVLPDDITDPSHLVLAYDDHKGHGELIRKGARNGPLGNAPVGAHNGHLHGSCILQLGDDQHLDVDVLGMDPVRDHGIEDGIDQGINDRGNIEQEEADAVEHDIHVKAQPAHAAGPLQLQDQHADQGHAAVTGSHK